MKVVILGATGMLGQGVLRECLLAPDVTKVLTIGRKVTGRVDPKLREVTLPDLTDYAPLENQLAGYDACFFCLGVTSSGMTEADYRRVTYDTAVAAARALIHQNPAMTFVFVSGAGTDSTEKGRTMWARVKGATENAILAMPFGAAFALRPSIIQPLHGITSRTTSYRIFYRLFGPIFPLLRVVAPGAISTTESMGLAMLNLARHRYSKRILENRDINRASAGELS